MKFDFRLVPLNFIRVVLSVSCRSKLARYASDCHSEKHIRRACSDQQVPWMMSEDHSQQRAMRQKKRYIEKEIGQVAVSDDMKYLIAEFGLLDSQACP